MKYRNTKYEKLLEKMSASLASQENGFTFSLSRQKLLGEFSGLPEERTLFI